MGYQFYERYAIIAERTSQWSLAAEHWRSAGRVEEANTCERIADALRKGDIWRARVATLQARGIPFAEAAEQATKEEYVP